MHLFIFPLSLFVFGKHWQIILISWHNSLAHLHSHLVFSPTPRPEQAELVKNSSKARRQQKNILLCTSPVETVSDCNFQILNLEKLVLKWTLKCSQEIVFPFKIDNPKLNFKSIEFPLLHSTLFKKSFKYMWDRSQLVPLCLTLKDAIHNYLFHKSKGCFLATMYIVHTYFIPHRNTYTKCTLSSKTENT